MTRSRGVALALSVLGGIFGLHRFYTGHTKTGVWMGLTLGGLGVWYLYDVIVIAAGDFRDSEGRRFKPGKYRLQYRLLSEPGARGEVEFSVVEPPKRPVILDPTSPGGDE